MSNYDKFFWSSKYGIEVNIIKCQAIIIVSSLQLVKLNLTNLGNFRLKYNGNVINYSRALIGLGIILNTKLSWRDYASDISRKIYFSLHSMMRLNFVLPVSTKIQLVRTLLLPVIDYGGVCCLDMNSEVMNKLERIFNTLTYNLHKYGFLWVIRYLTSPVLRFWYIPPYAWSSP